MLTQVALYVTGLLVLFVIYIEFYAWRFNDAIRKYIKAYKEGKHPCIGTGAVWFNFVENTDYSKFPDHFEPHSFIVSGEFIIPLYHWNWKKVIPEY